MNESAVTSLIDLIYDAAFDEPGWVGVMNRLSDAVGGGVTAFIRKNLDTGEGSGLYGRIDAAQFTDYFGRFAHANPFTEAVAAARAGTALIDWQLVAKPTLMRTPYYNDFLLRRDIHAVLGLMAWRRGADVAIINLTRPPGHEDFQPQDIRRIATFLPHLRRAVALAERLPPWPDALRHDALWQSWRSAIVILDRDGRLIHANAAAEAILLQQDGLRVVLGKLTAAYPACSRRLAALIRQAAEGTPPVGGGLGVPRPSGQRPYAVQIVPCRPAQRGLFPSPARVIACLADLERPIAPAAAALRSALGLTPAQAAVAALVARGDGLAAIAASLGISRFTVRRHLADIMACTDTHDRAALVALLARLPAQEPAPHAGAPRH